MANAMCPSLPSLVLEKIFLNLPAEDVALNCRSVCGHWMVACKKHWVERCWREGIMPSRPPKNWLLFYFLSKKRRNLLINPRSEDGLNGWESVGGDTWMCYKRQLINLRKDGYSPALMDDIQPDIKISDWYAPNSNGQSCYEILVELLDQNKKPINVFHPEPVNIEQGNDQQSCQVSHVFKAYGPGVRFICFTHGMIDTGNWAGSHGIQAINSSVEICPEKE